MVFRGKPSKSCERCRSRRLKCDLLPVSCSSCLRANVTCSGYRNTDVLRITDESNHVKKKSQRASQKADPAFQILVLPQNPWYLPLALESQARDAFFSHYVTSSAKTWDFLAQYYNPVDGPSYLSSSIDACSLAYLAHEVCSDAALTAGREKYVSALHATTKALKCPREASKDTTILASLLLDLFEKITYNEPQTRNTWTDHINGALALVQLRGLDKFRGESDIRVLVRLFTNHLICCVARDAPIPYYLEELRDYAASQLNPTDPKWQLSGLMVEYTNLRYRIRHGKMSKQEQLVKCLELDTKYETLSSNKPLAWQSTTTIAQEASERVHGDYFRQYGDKHITQTWNVLRLARILLNESVVECLESDLLLDRNALKCDFIPLATTAKINIENLGSEICASVPQYNDCKSVATEHLLCSEFSTTPEDGISDIRYHLHSPSHTSECYTLIYPLFVAGQSRYTPETTRTWIQNELRYMGSHFGIRNAELTCHILEKGERVNPWEVYAMLGSYAFAA